MQTSDFSLFVFFEQFAVFNFVGNIRFLAS